MLKKTELNLKMFDFFKKKEDVNTPQTENHEEKKSFLGSAFDSLKHALSKTGESLVDNIVDNVSQEEDFDEFILDDMEDLLIKADLGVNCATEIVDKLRKKNTIKPSEVKEFLRQEFTQILESAGDTQLNYKENQLNIYFITGVNGAGKTTLIGKLANKFKNENKRVLIAAGDTFRAAAEEQLDIWAQRADAQIVRRDGADPASVVYDAIQKAKNENFDVLLVDTAGRLQNKYNLMEELNKVKKVIDKNAPECISESMLVLDANTGQNGLSQAKIFSEAVNLSSVALTKLDGSAKGGIIISIARDFKLPVKLIGIGEKIDDLKNFNPQEFISAIFNK